MNIRLYRVQAPVGQKDWMIAWYLTLPEARKGYRELLEAGLPEDRVFLDKVHFVGGKEALVALLNEATAHRDALGGLFHLETAVSRKTSQDETKV